jgi:DNA-binding SARP family transcriptional activator
MTEVRVGVLGTAVADVDGVHHQPGAARLRALLTVLAMHAGRPVTTDHIIEAVWGSSAPTGVTSTLQGYVADLRRILEPHRAPREPARVLVTVPSGYALNLAPEALDLTRFEGALRQAARELAVITNPLRPWVSVPERASVERAADRLDAALDEWRGEPLTDLGTDLEVACERDRLRALRLEAEILRHTAHLALGRHATAVADLEWLARAHPWNEQVWGLRAIALVGTGNQAEALACLRRLRTSLSEELGLDPSPQVRDLEAAIFRQELPLTSSGEPGVAQAAPPAACPASWPLVGRQLELDQLDAALDLAERGRVQFVHLSGEQGVGKTRLARELAARARARGFATVWAGCMREATDIGLWAWHRLAGRLEQLDDSRAAGAGPGVETDGARPALLGLGERTLRTLRSVSDRTPLLLVLEDAHLADESTLRAVTHLVTALDGGRLVVLLTQRLSPGLRSGAMTGLLSALARVHALHLDLTGLDDEEVAALVGAVSDLRPQPETAAELRRRTDGNPFLAIELARGGDVTGASLPPSVHAVVADRLAELPESTLELLAGASLLDPAFDAGLLARAAGMPVATLHAHLSPAVSTGLLVEESGDRYSIRQAIVREVLDASLSHLVRARWEARIASVLGHGSAHSLTALA